MVDTRFETQALALPPAIPQLRHEVIRYAESLGAQPDTLESLQLAVSEALTNVVVHAYVGREPGPMIVEAFEEDEHLLVRVYDDGPGLIPRLDSPGLGLGIGLMASMANDFNIANRDGTPGTIVSLRFTLSEAACCVLPQA